MRTYLEWRCRTNWHNKYRRYIEEWISNVTEEQMMYFERERENLIKMGKYDC